MKLTRKPEAKDLISIVLLLLLLCLFVWIGVSYTRIYGEIKGGDMISSAENLKELVLSYGGAGVLIIILLHILQVVISVIPAAIVQFAGGMIYGMPVGMITGIVGVAVGTAISFSLARFLGRRVVTLFVSEKSLNKLEGVLSKDASVVVLFVLYIIPFPKDMIAYVVGLTKMKASKLFVISAVGRLPGMFTASYLGTHLFERNYPLLISVTVACCVISLLAYIFRDKIFKLIPKK